MKNILEFNDFGQMLNEGRIPVYDAVAFDKNPRIMPTLELKLPEVMDYVTELFDKVESGELERVTVLANIPSQGKKAPQYVTDIIADEKKRLSKRRSAEYGTSRITAEDRPDDYDYTDDLGNIFIDSEYVIDEIVNTSGESYFIGIPESFYDDVTADPSLKSYYGVRIEPTQVEEVYFTEA